MNVSAEKISNVAGNFDVIAEQSISPLFNLTPDIITGLTISIPTGVVTGLLASLLFLYYTKRKIPTIIISKHLITDCDPVSSEKSLSVKFVNTTKRDLINVSVILYADFYHNDDKSMGTYKELYRKDVPFIPRHDEKDEKMKYAIQATFPVCEGLDIDSLKEKYHSLSVKVVGQDCYYGTYATVVATFNFDDIKEDSIFELGLNTNSRYSKRKS